QINHRIGVLIVKSLHSGIGPVTREQPPSHHFTVSRSSAPARLRNSGGSFLSRLNLQNWWVARGQSFIMVIP
ncbi:hypothetical protein LINPERHAP1_LOCUS1490, partial [Linum perenne]